jgi:putative oxidoreductase
MRLTLFSTFCRNSDLTLLFYRILVGASLFFVHGAKKLTHFEAELNSFPDPFGFGTRLTFFFAIFASLICPLLLMLGVLTRLACLGILAVTLTGLFLVHLHDPLEVMDTPYIYSVSVLLLFFLGPGKYSLDHRITK